MKHKADAKRRGLKFSHYVEWVEYWIDKQGQTQRYHIGFKVWL